jgi:hypothetical protein
MRSPLLALTWQTWGRHRWGLAAVVGVLAALWGLQRLFPEQLVGSSLGVMVLVVPLCFAFVFPVYAFSYAEASLTPRAHTFPPWMFTLPIRTSVMVLLPMLSATAAVAATWLAVALLLLQPAGVEAGTWRPALGLAVVVAWIQAVDWSPLPALAKVVVVGAVMALVGAALGTERFRVLAYGGLPALLPLAYLAAVAAVAHARRGAAPVGIPAWLPALPALRLATRRPFASPALAQLWLEWRRNGTLLPLVLGGWTLFYACLIPFSGRSANTNVLLFNLLVMTPLLSPLVGCVLGKPDVWSRQMRLPSSLATQPVGTGAMVVAKLQMAALSVLATWAMLGLSMAVWWVLAGNYEQTVDYGQSLLCARPEYRMPVLAGGGPMDLKVAKAEMLGGPSYAFVLLLAVSLFGFAWLQLCGHLVVGLTGRLWPLLGTIICYLVVLPNLFAASMGVKSSFPALWAAWCELLPWLWRLAVVAKLLLAAWAFHTTYRRGLLSGRAIAGIILAWSAVAGSAFGFLWMALAVRDVEAEDIAVAVALLLPLARVALAPLSLAWNRHR